MIINEVDLVSITGRTARIDFIGRLGLSNPVCTEIKTSLVHQKFSDFTGDEFKRNQPAVFSLIPLGGHVASSNSKVQRVGLTPNVPFPPMRLDIIYAIEGVPYSVRTIDPGTPIPPGSML